MKSRVLYISYDGILEPLGQSQVLSYLERLSADHAIYLLSFEKPTDLQDEARYAAMQRRVADAGIVWTALRYHSKPSGPATAYDIGRGLIAGLSLVRQHGLAVVHARSYVASVMALAIKRLTGAKYIFDMRGFWADERVDAGLWMADARMYRLAKGFEKRFFLAADAIVSLTNAGAEAIRQFDYLKCLTPPITVIPTCADLDSFRPRPEARPTDFVLGYVGSIGTWYLFDAVLACFSTLKQIRPDARLLVVNRHQHELARAMIADSGIRLDDVQIVAAEHWQVPELISGMTAGTAFYKPAYHSNLARAPTKLAEFLGSGIPCLGTADVGDMTEILECERVGVVLSDFDEKARRAAVERLVALAEDPETPRRCAAAARKWFSLQRGVERYADIYCELAGA